MTPSRRSPLRGFRRHADPRIVGALAALGFFLCSLPGPAPASAQEPEPGPDPGTPAESLEASTVRVAATGTAEVEPDRVVLWFAVETVADSAGAAVAANAERMTTVRRAMEGLEIPAERIQTSGYHLQPEYAREPPREGAHEPRITGYRASNQLRVTVDSASRAGEVIDVAVGAGANRVSGISFESSRSEEAGREALADAVENARLRAEAIARAAGRRLGALVEVASGGGDGGPIPMMEMAAARGGGTPIEPGRLTVTERVTAVWKLEPPE